VPEEVRVLVLGLGNPILTDDGVGIYVARKARSLLAGRPVEIVEASVGGLGVLDLIQGYDALVVVDSMLSEKLQPGEIAELDLDSLMKTQRLGPVHGVNFATVLALGRDLGLPVPEHVEIYVIGVRDVESFGEQCTPEVAAAVHRGAHLVKERVIAYLDHVERKKTPPYRRHGQLPKSEPSQA